MRRFVMILILAALAGCGDGAEPGLQNSSGVPDAEGPPEIYGQWRTVSGSPEWIGEFVMEIRFERDGSYRIQVDFGFGILEEKEATFQTKAGELTMQLPWSNRPMVLQFELERDRLTLRDSNEYNILERSDEPHPDLVDLPPVPRTVEDAVATLRKIVTEEDQQKIREMDEDDLSSMHFGLGLYVRNAFGLVGDDSPLLRDCEETDPDSASGIILQAFWKSLQGE